MRETKCPLKVFLYHAHSDATAVRAFGGRVGGLLLPYRDHNRLVSDGVNTWLDKEKLLPGADWEYEIR